MPELLDILTYDSDVLAAAEPDVPDNYPVDVDTVAADEVQVRIAGTRDAGSYRILVSSEATIDSANNAVFSRLSLDGGATWTEASRAAANSGDNLFLTYGFPIAHGGGAFDYVLQMKKETGLNTLQVNKCSIEFQRVG